MTDKAMSSTSGNQALSSEGGGLTIDRYGRFWAVYDNRNGCGCSEQQTIKQQNVGQLVCLTVYKKGAHEVVRRLQAAAPKTDED